MKSSSFKQNLDHLKFEIQDILGNKLHVLSMTIGLASKKKLTKRQAEDAEECIKDAFRYVEERIDKLIKEIS